LNGRFGSLSSFSFFYRVFLTAFIILACQGTFQVISYFNDATADSLTRGSFSSLLKLPESPGTIPEGPLMVMPPEVEFASIVRESIISPVSVSITFRSTAI
jgi:hypothetical protein